MNRDERRRQSRQKTRSNTLTKVESAYIATYRERATQLDAEIENLEGLLNRKTKRSSK